MIDRDLHQKLISSMIFLKIVSNDVKLK